MKLGTSDFRGAFWPQTRADEGPETNDQGNLYGGQGFILYVEFLAEK